MPIIQRSENAFEQVCAACGARRTVANADVKIRERDGYSALELPPCVCGAVEVLLPSVDETEHPTLGGDGHLHQLAVDELAARVCNARLSPKKKTEIAHWLPAGTKIAVHAARG